MTDTCKRGHPWNEENTRVTRTGYRQCRACRRKVRKAEAAPAPVEAATTPELLWAQLDAAGKRARIEQTAERGEIRVERLPPDEIERRYPRKAAA